MVKDQTPVQRRLAAILAGDAVGYGRLIGPMKRREFLKSAGVAMSKIYRQGLGAVVALLCALTLSSARASEPTIAGVWQQVDPDTGGVGGLIAFSEKGGVWEGHIVKTYPEPGDPPNPTCSRCTDDRKGKPILGLRLIQNAKRSGLKYEGGTILDPRNGSQYTVELTLSPDNHTLTVRGFVGVTLFGQSQQWKRLSESDPEYPKLRPPSDNGAPTKKKPSGSKAVQGKGGGS